MVTGFPPYDMPTREDERFDIICHGDLMRQLQAWDSKYCMMPLLCLSCRVESNVFFHHYPLLVHLSEEAGDLLQWMLAPNPADRPSLSQVMMHEWVVRGEIHPPNSF